MVTDRIRSRREDHRSPNAWTERGQVILIGAVALAFIILGVVVVFNGVVYTETLSSADTGQSASGAETTELEVRQGISCLVDEASKEDALNESIENEYLPLYRNTTANSQPAVVDLEVSGKNNPGNNVTIKITYDSEDLEYERNVTINADRCPS